MRLRFRSQKEELPLGEALELPPGPEQFLESQAGLLMTSRRSWQLVADTFLVFQEEEFAQRLRDIIDSQVDKLDIQDSQKPHTKESHFRKSLNLPDELGSYFLTSSSLHSSEYGTLDEEIQWARINLPTTQDPAINEILESILQDPRYSFSIASIAGHIHTGNVIRDEVVGNLVEVLKKRPSLLSELTILSTSNQQEIQLAELRKICATDWHLPKAEDSKLQQYVEAARTDPDLHVEGFIAMLDSARENDKRLARVRELTQFALACEGIDISTNPSVRSELLASQNQWDRFPDVSRAFEEYRRIQSKKTQAGITDFVGLPHAARSRIRFPRDEMEREALKGSFYKYFDSDTGSKKHRAQAKRVITAKSTPRTKDIVAQEKNGHESRERAPEFELAVVKQGPNGSTTIKPVEVADLLRKFSKKPILRDDIERMLERLVRNPIGEGSKRLTNLNIKINGRPIALRRFTSREVSDLTLRSEEGWRFSIVFVIEGGRVAIKEILSHPEFDKKYTP